MGATSMLNTTFVREPVNGGLNFIVAVGWGLLSAFSLVIGAWIGITQAPSPKVNASMMAFGGGALIQALSIELFGAILQHQAETGIGCTMAAIAAAVVGGAFFSFLNKVLNDQGAFLRKRATLAKVLRKVSFKDGLSQLDQTRQQLPEPDFEPEIELEKHENADGPRHNGTLDESTHAQGSHQGAGGHQGGKNAAIMIWLGIGLDAIPESFVLGILANAGNVSSLITFTVGVFLANLPEAMSSAAIMKQYSMKPSVIMGMWTAIFVGTGLGAGLGAICFP
eukprot:jgi/Chrpa1/21533/Chrysochromulina_OHIO_Genome00023681-RA